MSHHLSTSGPLSAADRAYTDYQLARASKHDLVSPLLFKALQELVITVDAGTSSDYRALQEHRVMRVARAVLAKSGA